MAGGIAFVTYETPFSPCGGIASVMKYLPQSICARSGMRTVVLSPFHYQLPSLQQLPHKLRGVISVPVEGQPLMIQILQLEVPGDVEWLMYLPEDRRYFSGKRHPYDLDPGSPFGASLLRDTLLFGQCVARSLHVLGPGTRWTLMMQDWEGASAALALAADPHEHSLWLTLHNSYDSVGVEEELLRSMGFSAEHCRGSRSNTTLLERALRLVQKPIFTVSEGFAFELREEPFQREVMIPHLQPILSRAGTPQILGIDNGPFTHLSIPQEVFAASKSRRGEALRAWKKTQRAAFCEALRAIASDEVSDNSTASRRGFASRPWGDLGRFLGLEQEGAPPWIAMGGRDDPRQKGFDVAASAARKLLDSGVDARFLFFPLPGDEGLAGLRFLADLAWEFPGKVLVFPFFFREGYLSALQGSTFAWMPSFYEPFGAANEFYFHGTLGIGRATGGLVQQIVPLREAPTLPEWGSFREAAVSRRAAIWHAADARPTGVLYREPEDIPSTVEDWRGINMARYSTLGDGPNRMEQRAQFEVWNAMVRALEQTTREAIELYHQLPDLYEEMILDGCEHIQASFSWQICAEGYLRCIAPHALKPQGLSPSPS